jgi:eukaryotic-like serine/threonine-protein kinase
VEGGAASVGAGTVLAGRYRLERRIGSGGMASVWLARDEDLGRDVAVKVLADTLAEEPGYLERFRREATLAAGFSHPNLVRVFDYSPARERPYLVMEYVAGGTLADRIGADEPDAIDAERLGTELLGALDEIHSAGIVHRDVKPANILVGTDGRARLTDFGIAQPEDATKLTKTGEVIGTLRYMAPEVLDGAASTPRSDLYSCGIVLRDCAGGDPSPPLAGAIDAMTAPDPAARPAGAAAAADLFGSGATATAPTARIPEGDHGHRELEIPAWALVAALLGALAAIGAVLALAGGGDDQGGSRGRSADRPPARTQTVTSTAQQTVEVPAEPAPKPPKPEKKPKPKPEEPLANPSGKIPPGHAKKAKH